MNRNGARLNMYRVLKTAHKPAKQPSQESGGDSSRIAPSGAPRPSLLYASLGLKVAQAVSLLVEA